MLASSLPSCLSLKQDATRVGPVVRHKSSTAPAQQLLTYSDHRSVEIFDTPDWPNQTNALIDRPAERPSGKQDGRKTENQAVRCFDGWVYFWKLKDCCYEITGYPAVFHNVCLCWYMVVFIQAEIQLLTKTLHWDEKLIVSVKEESREWPQSCN